MTVEEAIGAFVTAPMLFIGSGVSRRYCEAPTWKALLQQLAEKVGVDYNYPWKSYLSEAGYTPEESESKYYPRIAELLQRDFDLQYYKDKNFADQFPVKEEDIKNDISPFMSYLSCKFSNVGVAALKEEEQRELSYLEEAAKHSVNGVITTNYDNFIESVFPKFKVFIGQDGLLMDKPTGYMEIYKIHGCCSKPMSMVFTEKSYEKYREGTPYLAAKLLAFFVENPILFLGYSFNDPDIMDIINALAVCLNDEQMQKMVDRMIFVQYDDKREEPYVGEQVFRVGEKTLVMRLITTKSFEPIFKALVGIKYSYDLALLRRIREDIYRTVQSNTPVDCVKVISSDVLEGNNVKGKVIGIATGYEPIYKTLKSEHIYRHVVLESEGIEIPSFVRDKLPELIQGKSCDYPFFYYARKAIEQGVTLPDCMAEYAREYSEYDSILGRDIKRMKKEEKEKHLKKRRKKGKGTVDYSSMTLDELVNAPDIKVLYQKILLLDRCKLENGKLGGYLRNLFKEHPDCLSPSATYTTYLKRLVRVFDYLENGRAVLHHLENGTKRCLSEHPTVTGAVEKARGQSSTNPHGTPSAGMLP